MNLPKRLIGLILLLVASIAHASSKKKGDLFYNNFAYKDAIVEYQKSLSSGDSSVLRNLAHSHKLLHQYDQAMINYGYLVNRKEHTNDDIYAYAEMLKANHKMEEANKWMETYFANESSYDAKTHPTFNQDFLTQLNKNRGSYKIETMSINSKYIDHAPVIFEEKGQEKLLFVSSRKIKGNSKHKNLWTGEDYYEFYTADKLDEDQGFGEPIRWDVGFKSEENEDAACFSADGNEMYFTKNTTYDIDKTLTSVLEVVVSKKEGDKWSKPEKLSFNDKHSISAHPSISTDGKTLYFTSNRDGGYGGMDLYKVEKQNGEWGEPVNLGPEINTISNEIFPFYHSEEVLFFSSDRVNGLGGLDLYGAKFYNGQELNVQNLGVPLNSEYDDFSLTMDKEMKQGYFSSDRKGGLGKDDIYKVTFIKDVVFDVELKLLVKDAKTNNLLNTVALNFYANDEKIKTVNTQQGQYISDFHSNHKLLVELSKDNYGQKKQEVLLGMKDTVITVLLDPKELPKQKVIPVVDIEEVYIAQGGTAGKDDPLNTSNTEGSNPNFTGSNIEGTNSSFTDSNNNSKTTDHASPNYTEAKDESKKLGEETFAKNIPSHEALSTGSKKHDDDKETAVLGKKYFTTVPTTKEEIQKRIQELEASNITTVHESVFKPIYYTNNSYKVINESIDELKKVATYLKENNDKSVELHSYTDCRGTDAYNVMLSKRRALAIQKYLIFLGVKNEKIKVFYTGEDDPVARCYCDDAIHCDSQYYSNSRRTELVIK